MSELSIKALGEFVVLTSKAASAGTEEKTASGIVLGVLQQGEQPIVCTVHAIGENVPAGFVEIGDMTPVPPGSVLKNVPHPLVANGHAKAKDIEQKFFSVHYTHIPAVYKKN